MKLLREFDNLADAQTFSERLRDKGIFTHVSSAHSTQMSRIKTGVFKNGVWAVIDNQIEDAVALTNGQKIKVRHPISKEEMASMQAYANSNLLRLFKPVFFKVLPYVIFFVLSTACVIYSVQQANA